MNDKKKRVLISRPVLGHFLDENCYILTSYPKRPLDETYGETRVKTAMSFLYRNGRVAAEWEPEHGPIQIWYECEPDDDGAQEHYFFDFHNTQPASWSQLAVDENQLPDAANRGDWRYIFDVLKRWASRDDHE